MYQNWLVLLSKQSDEFWSAAHWRLLLARPAQNTLTAEPGSHEYVQSDCQVSIWEDVHRNSLLAHGGWENLFLTDFILGRMSANSEAVKSLDGQKTDPSFEDVVTDLASSYKCYPFCLTSLLSCSDLVSASWISIQKLISCRHWGRWETVLLGYDVKDGLNWESVTYCSLWCFKNICWYFYIYGYQNKTENWRSSPARGPR